MDNKQRVMWFFITTCAASWIIWLLPIIDSNGIADLPFNNDLLRFIGSFMPTLIAFVFTWRSDKLEGVKRLLLKGIKFKFSWKWYLYIFLLIPCISVLALIAAKLFAGFRYEAPFPFWFIAPAFFIILLVMGPLEEEFGWRGYALDRLLDTCKPLYAGIIIGLVWSVWHLPLFFIKGTIQNNIAENGFAVVFLGYSVQTVLLSVLMTVLYKNTGSVFAAILIHTVSNLTYGVIPIYSTLQGGECLLIVYLLVTTGILFFQKCKRGNVQCSSQSKTV